jgi:hypothetical protein
MAMAMTELRDFQGDILSFMLCNKPCGSHVMPCGAYVKLDLRLKRL